MGSKYAYAIDILHRLKNMIFDMTKAIKLLNNNSNDETYNPNDSSE